MICNNGVATSLSLLSETWQERSNVTLNVNEAAYRVLLQNGNRIWHLRKSLTNLELLHMSKCGNSYDSSSAISKVVFTRIL